MRRMHVPLRSQWIVIALGLLGLANCPVAKSANRTDELHILLVDDYNVLYRAGTNRVFHPATLNPSNPVIREDKPWEMAIAWTSIHREPTTGKYQLWYQAYAGGRDERKTHKCVVCYAESDDGIHFTKPALTLHDFKTDREPWTGHFQATNIVLLGDGGDGDRYANSVLFDSKERDPARRYKMLYTDFGKDADGREWPGFFAAFSPDGVRWTKSSRNPLNRTAYGGRGLQPPFSDESVYMESFDKRKNFLRKTWKIPLSMSDAADVMFDPIRGKYAAYGKVWIQGPAGGLAWKHAMARVESRDFLAWSKPQIVCTTDDLDPPNTEFHTSPVFFYKGSHKLGLLPTKPSSVTGNSIGLAETPDTPKSEQFCATLDPGDATIHHCETIHHSDPNPTDQSRLGLLFVFRASHTATADQLKATYTDRNLC